MNRLEVGKLYRGNYLGGHAGRVAECLRADATYFCIFESDIVLVLAAIEHGGQIGSYKLLIGETVGELYIDEFSYDVEWTEIKE